MKQTAVEWLFDAVYKDMSYPELLGLIAQAKEMEKEQIIDAYQKGRASGQDNWGYGNDINSEQYYNETFKSE